MTGTVILTGAAGGLGLALAESIATRPESEACIFTVRNQSSPHAQPLRTLQDTTQGKTTEIHEMDLALLDSVRAFAADINKRVVSEQLPPIRALILNAAVIPFGDQRQYSNVDGEKMEMMFAVNHLANFLLTLLLLPSMDREKGRIVLVSSHAHDLQSASMRKHRPEKLPWDLEEIAHGDQAPDPGDEANDVMRRYGMSKLCQIMFMHELQARIDADPHLNKICVLAVNPGAMIHSNILNKMNPFMKYVVGPVAAGVFRAVQLINPDGIMRTVGKSAADVQRAAFSLDDPQLGAHPKGLYFDGARLVEPAGDSFERTKQRELWDFSVKMAGLNEDDVFRYCGAV